MSLLNDIFSLRQMNELRADGLWPTSFYAPILGQKAIFGYGVNLSIGTLSMTSLVSNTGVVGNDVTGVGTARANLAAAGYSLS